MQLKPYHQRRHFGCSSLYQGVPAVVVVDLWERIYELVAVVVWLQYVAMRAAGMF